MAPDKTRVLLFAVTVSTTVFASLFLAALFYIASVHDDVRRLRDDLDQIKRSLGSNPPQNEWGYKEEGDNGDEGYDEASAEVRQRPRTHQNDAVTHFRRFKREAEPKKKRKRRSRKPTMVHFEAISGTLQPSGTLTHWKYADWMKKSQKDKFPMRNGNVTVTTSGYYFIYAQVTFLDRTDHEFSIVKVNSDGKTTAEVACCMQSLHYDKQIGEDGSAMASCYTAKLMKVKKGEKIFILDKMNNSGASGTGRYTFFGMMKLV